jgi:hypothetical protein
MPPAALRRTGAGCRHPGRAGLPGGAPATRAHARGGARGAAEAEPRRLAAPPRRPFPRRPRRPIALYIRNNPFNADAARPPYPPTTPTRARRRAGRAGRHPQLSQGLPSSSLAARIGARRGRLAEGGFLLARAPRPPARRAGGPHWRPGWRGRRSAPVSGAAGRPRPSQRRAACGRADARARAGGAPPRSAPVAPPAAAAPHAAPQPAPARSCFDPPGGRRAALREWASSTACCGRPPRARPTRPARGRARARGRRSSRPRLTAATASAPIATMTRTTQTCERGVGVRAVPGPLRPAAALPRCPHAAALRPPAAPRHPAPAHRAAPVPSPPPTALGCRNQLP